MILPVNEKYRITSDEHQWIVQRSRSRKRKGARVVEWTSIRYYHTFEQCLSALGEQLVRDSDAVGFAEALVDVQKVCTTLGAALPTHIKVIAAANCAEGSCRGDKGAVQLVHARAV